MFLTIICLLNLALEDVGDVGDGSVCTGRTGAMESVINMISEVKILHRGESMDLNTLKEFTREKRRLEEQRR